MTTVSIDCAALTRAIGDLKALAGDLDSAMSACSRACAQPGFPSTPIGDLAQIADWLRDQVPGLQARVDIIRSMNGDPNFTGRGNYTVDGQDTHVAARRALGRELATHVDGGEAPDWVWEMLQKNSLDDEVSASFVETLGPQETAALTVPYAPLPDTEMGDEQRARFVTMSYVLAAAGRQGVVDRDFLAAFGPDGEAMNTLLIGSMLQYGDWDKQTLQTVGEAAFDTDTFTIGGPEQQALVLEGIARNPIAATEFYSGHFDLIQGLASQNPAPIGGATRNLFATDPMAEQVADFIRAATIDADREYELIQLRSPGSPNLAEQLTVRMMEWQLDNPDDHRTPATQQAFADIITHYRDDLYASVTSTVPDAFSRPNPDRDGIEASDELWSALLQESLRNGEAAGGLSVVFKNDIERMVNDAQREDAGDAKVFNGLDLAQAGHLELWFVTQVGQVRQELGDEVDDWNKGVEKGVSAGVDLLFAGGASVATGNPAPFLLEAGKQGAKALIGEMLDKEPEPYVVDTEWARNFSSRWRQSVENNREQVEPVTVDGVTYDGDPQMYQELYGGSFTNASGEVLPYDDIKDNPQALEAYSQWLEDPAIQQAAYWGWFKFFSGQVPSPQS